MIGSIVIVYIILCFSCGLQSVESNTSDLAILSASNDKLVAAEGDNITISLTLQNVTDVVWTVCCRGLLIVDSTKFQILEDLPLSASLIIIDANEDDIGIYTVTISNDIDTLEQSFEVSIQAFPEFLDQPLSTTEVVQEVIQLVCIARGNPVPDITWFKDDGMAITNGEDLSITDLLGESVSSSVLVIESLSIDVAGSYYCNATNDLVVEKSISSERAIVTSLYAPDVSITPTTSLTVNVTDMASINCSVFGIPLPNVTWIVSDDGLEMEVTSDGDEIEIVETDVDNTRVSVLMFNNVSKFDEGLYSCIGRNDIDNVLNTPTSGSISFIVQVPPTVYHITSSPIYAIEGQTITLQFEIIDDDPPVQPSNIVWTILSTVGEETVMNSSSSHFTFSSNNLMVTIDHIQVSAHEGTYVLTALNEAGIGTASIEVIIETPPKIFKLPKDIIALEGDEVSFDCLVIGSPVPDQTWLLDDSPIIIDIPRITIGEELYGTLSINGVMFEDGGVYTCIYNSTIGDIVTTAELTVQVRPRFEAITVPVNGTAGGNIIMTCNSTGVPEPAITWLKNGNPVTSVIGEAIISTDSYKLSSGIDSITSTLQLLGLVLNDTSNYSCRADNDLARPQTETSEELELLILYPPDVSISSESLTVNQSDGSTFTCQSFGIPVPSFSWFFNNSMDSQLSNNDQFSITNTIITNSSGLDILISTLTIQNTIRSLHEGVYTCMANNGVDNLIGTPESAEINVIVQVPPRVLIVTVDPVGVVNRSTTISFNIDQASPTVVLQNIEWRFNDNTILNNGSQAILVDQMFSSDLLSLTLTNIQNSNQGYYSLIATNEAGTDSSEIFLEVEAAPVITLSPEDSMQFEGLDVMFQCEAISEPLYAVSWQFNETFINSNDEYLVNETTGELTVFDVTLNSTGVYTCIVDNIHGNDSASATLTVQVVPQFTVDPIESLVLLIGESVQLNCSSFAVPASNITWLKDDSVLDVASLEVLSSIDEFTTFSRITITNVNFTNTGLYSCRAENDLVSLQSTISMPATITVNMPVIILESPNDSIVNETDTIQYKCVAEGLPTPSITWSTPQIVDLLTIDSVKIKQSTDGSNVIESTLTFDSIMDTDANNYTCTAINTPRDNTVTVYESFSITVQTQPVVAFTGNETVIGVQFRDVQMTFNVSRDLPLVEMENIRWFFTQQGTDTKKEIIPEDQPNHYTLTNSRLTLTITFLNMSDSGTYTVEASNIVGTGSASTILEVQRAPVIIVPLVPLIQLSGTNATFTCEAEANPQHTIEWTKGDQELFNSSKILITGLGTARSVLTIIDLELSDTGSYSCFAENVHGNDSTTDELFVQVPPSFLENPSPLNLTAGGNVTIFCNATGFPEPTVTIIKNGETLSGQFNRLNGSLSNGLIYQSVSLFLSEVTFTDTGYYSCNASNNFASLQTVPSPPSIYTVQYAPNVSITPLSIIVNESDSITLICQVMSLPSPNIIWLNSSSDEAIVIDNTIVVTEQVLSNPSGIPVTAVSNLTITTILKTHEANYTCIANNDVENLLGTPEDGTIPVIVQVPPTVIAIDESVLGVVNRSAMLGFRIERASPEVDIANIRWTITSSTDNSIEDITTSTDDRLIFSMDLLTLTIINITNDDEGVYTLIATNPAGIMSAIVNFSVEAPPVFVQKPQDISVLSGSSATYTCNATSEPLHSIRWQREESVIAQYLSPHDRLESVDEFARLNSTVTGVPIVIDDTKYQLAGEGLLYGQLTVMNTVLDDGRLYTCIASNVHGNVSASASLLVQVTPVFTNEFSSIVNTSLAENVTFACNADGQPKPNITWYRDGIELTADDKDIYIMESEGARQFNSSLTILEVSRAHEGEYWCNATNYLFVRFEEMSPRWTVNVHIPPNVVKTPNTLQRQAAQYAIFTCEITAFPAPIIQWTGTGTNDPITDLKGKFEIKDITDDSSVVGPYSIETQLTIFNLSFTDQQTYTCTGISRVSVNNFINAQNNASASLFVNVPPRVIAVTNSFSTALWNKQFNITFDVINAQPLVDPQDITWTFDPSDDTGTVMLDDNSDRLTFRSDRQSLVITSIRLSDIGRYTLTAINNGGSSTATVTINVLVEPMIDSITTSTNKTTVTIGNSITLTCRGDGIPTPLLTWRRNGTILTTTGRTNVSTRVIQEGIRTEVPTTESVISILTLSDIKDTDDYSVLTCIAENSVGSDQQPYLLRVDRTDNPCIPNPCQNNGLCYINDLSFVCICTEGYTEELCDIRANPIGIVSPSILVPPQPISNELHSIVNLTCIADGNPQPNIEWYKNGAIINEAKAFQYTFELGLNDRGWYHCKAVSNLRGGSTLSVSSEPAVLVTINNVFQYLMTVSVSINSLQELYGNDLNNDQLIDTYVQRINTDFSGVELTNSSVIFSVSLHEIIDQSNNVTFNTLITLLSDAPYREPLYNFLSTYKSNPLYVLENLIRFDGCVSEVTAFSSNYYWPETNLGFNVTLDCPCGDLSLGEGRPTASRRCNGNFTTTGAQWSVPDNNQCDFNSGAQSLCQVTDAQNISIVLAMIDSVSSDVTTETELVISIALLENRFNEAIENITVVNQFLSVIDKILTVDENILKSAQEMGNTSSRILEILDQTGSEIPVSTDFSFNQSSFSLSIYDATMETFELTIADTNSNYPITINITSSSSASNSSNSKYIITVFPDDRLFLGNPDSRLASTVVGITNNNELNLNQSTTMRFSVNQTLLSLGSESLCVFWDFQLNNNQGDWSDKGCYKLPNTNGDSTDITCFCSHFTHFAVIVKTSSNVTNDEVDGSSFLTGAEAIVVVVSVISMVFLIVTIVLYLNAWTALERASAKLFINTCVALIALYLIYVGAIYSKGGNISCIVFAAIFHYSFLVAVAAILLECIFFFLKRFRENVEFYSPVIIITTWIIPALIVIFCVAPAHHLYSTNNTCRPREAPFYLGLIIPFTISMLLSWVLLIIVLIKNKTITIQWIQLLIVSCVFSFGWIFALAVGEVVPISAATLQIIFILTGGLLGLYVFVLYCIGFSPVRRYLCRMKKDDNAYCTNQNTQAVNIEAPSNSMQRLMKVINIDDDTVCVNTEVGSPKVETVDTSFKFKNDDITTKTLSEEDKTEMTKETNF